MQARILSWSDGDDKQPRQVEFDNRNERDADDDERDEKCALFASEHGDLLSAVLSNSITMTKPGTPRSIIPANEAPGEAGTDHSPDSCITLE